MKSLIQKLNHLSNIANSRGFFAAQAVLGQWQTELQNPDNTLNKATKWLAEAALRDIEQNVLSKPDLADTSLAPIIRNAKKAIEINNELLKTFNSIEDEHVDTDAKRRFLGEQGAYFRRVRDTRAALTLEQLVELNRKFQDELKNAYAFAPDKLPAPYVPEVAPKPAPAAATPTDAADFAPRNQEQGLFKRFTNWMKDLADPTKSFKDAMMSMMTSVVQWVIGSVMSFFKPFLGADADGQIETFSQYAGKAFARYASKLDEPEDIPTFVPSFDKVRADHRAAAAASAATPSAAPTAAAGASTRAFSSRASSAT